MNISGIMRIFKSEYEGKPNYSTTISKKDQFGNYENMYITVQLPKDVELENKTRIDVTRGFISFYKTKQGLPKVKAVVQEFKPVVAEEPTGFETNYEETPSYYGDDLPF